MASPIPNETTILTKQEYYKKQNTSLYTQQLQDQIVKSIDNSIYKSQFYTIIPLSYPNKPALVEACRSLLQEIKSLNYCATYLYEYTTSPTVLNPRYPTSLLITWGSNKTKLLNDIIYLTKQNYPHGYEL